MAKGYQSNRERQEIIAGMGKALAKRAKFVCEWCEGKEDLRPWENGNNREPTEETVALLCGNCRGMAEGRKAEDHELRIIRNALWSPIPAVSEGAARVIAQSRDSWAREAIEDSMIDERLKEELLRS
ncbi:hypothetical protein Geob_1323 [Geotalea daltonii FRC-32]|uniref:Uncharacterized protein n=1 Tax=Geotalea daltonii (strain DSM 22248 / JCM 15807 / FRC-32) TaxID=316067 RepID=B9M4F7_GEODF|nr:hypothetical protein [Geotalea daltonii]ACM19683.1 hypothetical protein Geob_1323 [Geotalea daltonii FRC-32]